MKIIGTRKMIVSIVCAICITVIIMYYGQKDKALGTAEVTGMFMITALGGAYTFKNGLKKTPLIDAKKSG